MSTHDAHDLWRNFPKTALEMQIRRKSGRIRIVCNPDKLRHSALAR
jgi:hypothetical protein